MKLKRKLRLKLFKYFIQHLILFFVAILFGLFYRPIRIDNLSSFFVIVLLIYSILFVIPFIILILNYYFILEKAIALNKSGSLDVDSKFEIDGQKIINVKKIRSASSKPNNEPAYFPWLKGLFFYYVLEMSNNKRIIINCLHGNEEELDRIFKPVKTKNAFYPLIV